MAIEDAACLGILLSRQYMQEDINESVSIYEAIRLPRATKVQAAAAKAATNLNERIGELPDLYASLLQALQIAI